MCQGSNAIQDMQTKRRDGMDKERGGMMMEKYTLGESRVTLNLKERCTSCNRMDLTHSTT